eukprot:CAMPEP_0181454712 /NCGR_PEP_ID=MMETSP1110-20121109/30381_1 /TAXON_ID=174948 /ORGANISM="Symbiodinium sp., Strain CCMP421" /LENGTH=136 /DNA_ID=CAMNT_0023579069 /DNA_START=194 /DNA_END=604 /DNA_ORIENTATION=+
MNYGSCSAGSACRYCHSTHNGKLRLSKKQRDDLKSLGEGHVLALVLPHLLAKKLPGQEELISLLEQHLASLPSDASASARLTNFRSLNRRLASLSFRQLLDVCRCKELSQIRDSILNLQTIIGAQNPAVFTQTFSV